MLVGGMAALPGCSDKKQHMRQACDVCSDGVPAQYIQNVYVFFLERKNILCFENSRLILEEHKPALLPDLSFKAERINYRTAAIVWKSGKQKGSNPGCQLYIEFFHKLLGGLFRMS